MTETDGLLTADDYKMALDARSACNLSGIVHSLSRVMNKIWNEARSHGFGTDFVNRHPICRLYASQICYLSGAGYPSDDESFTLAMRECEEMSKVTA